MNQESVNNMVGRLPIAMAGIVHDFSHNGRSLSICDHIRLSLHEKTPALALSDEVRKTVGEFSLRSFWFEG